MYTNSQKEHSGNPFTFKEICHEKRFQSDQSGKGAVEQGQVGGAKGPVQAQRGLGHPGMAAVAKHERLNRALRVGRMPNIAVAILTRLANTGLDEHFRVVGTHALYAYEAAAGVRFASEITATRDIDLLWDTRKRVTFAQKLAKDSPSMLAALQKVDKSFQIIDEQKYTAINKDGFEVDILRRVARDADPHPVRRSDAEDDFWVVQAKRADELMTIGLSNIALPM